MIRGQSRTARQRFPVSPWWDEGMLFNRRVEFMNSRPDTEAAPQPKKAYKTPSLTNYGQLKDLTTGGSGNKKENNGGSKP